MMTLRELIKQFLDEMGDLELEEVLQDNDLLFEIYNRSSACLVTLSIENIDTEAVH